jgi:hypothetical protein
VWRGPRRPSRRAYHEACVLVTRYRAQAREAAEIALSAPGRRALNAVLGVYRVIAAEVPRVARVLTLRALKIVEVFVYPNQPLSGART